MLVKATQSEMAEVMTAMEDTTREVINRSNIANEAGVALAEIQGVSNRLAELLQAISDAAQQQARGSEQVAKSMNEMSAVTRNTAAEHQADGGRDQLARAARRQPQRHRDAVQAAGAGQLTPCRSASPGSWHRDEAARRRHGDSGARREADVVTPQAWSDLILRRCGLTFRHVRMPT